MSKAIKGIRLAPEMIEGMKATLALYPYGTYRRCVDDDGYGWLEMACYFHPPCGCKVVGNGTLQLPLTILFCKAHRKVKP